MAIPKTQQITADLPKRKSGAKKAQRQYAAGGFIDGIPDARPTSMFAGPDGSVAQSYGGATEAMRPNQWGSSAPGSLSAVAKSVPPQAAGSVQAIADGLPRSTGSSSLDTLGTGQGSAPQFAIQSFSDKAAAAGRDPNAAYRPGQVGDPHASGLTREQQARQINDVPTARHVPAPSTMTSVDSLFPSRRGVAAFADGGEVKETPEQLIARMAAKYGTSGTTPAPDPVAQQAIALPAPPPPKATPVSKQGIASGLFGIVRDRKELIDKAANYANGGKILGPGTPTSDSIPARVRQTGEPIAVSTGERILSAAQDAMLQDIAKGAGFDSLDAMLEAGTGQAVGPTIRHGRRAAANGMAPEDALPYVVPVSRDPYILAQGAAVPRAATMQTPSIAELPANDQAIARTPLTSMGADREIAARSPVSPGGGQGIAGGLPDSRQATSPDRQQLDASTKAQSLVGTAQRAAGLHGGSDAIANGNAMLRALSDNANVRDKLNAAHEAQGDGIRYSTTPGVNGKAQVMISGAAPAKAEYLDTAGNPTNDWFKTDRYHQAIVVNARMSNLADQMKRDRLERDAYDPSITDVRARADARQSIADGDRRASNLREMQGRVLENQLKQTKLASDSRLGGLQSAYLAESDPARKDALGEQIRGLVGRSPANAEHLTLTQRRSNFEIDAARKAVVGLSPEEIRRRTAKTTNTGRENPDFDPTLEHALNLSNRRKIGDDEHFDQRQMQAAQSSQGTDGDTITRFRGDQAMAGHRLGKQTANGTEVFDSTGKLIGHYR